MKEEFVTKEIAERLKENGFKEGCFGYYIPGGDTLILNYNQWRGGCYEDCLYSHESLGKDVVGSDLIDVPTISQTLEWLRKEKGLHIEITASAFGYSYIISKTPVFGGTDIKFSKYDGPNDGGVWDGWKECILAGIEYILDNLIRNEF